MWTHFRDMHSGGDQKLDWEHIFIEAPEDEAVKIFIEECGRDPDNITCDCCGEDYASYEEDSLEDATSFARSRGEYADPPEIYSLDKALQENKLNPQGETFLVIKKNTEKA